MNNKMSKSEAGKLGAMQTKLTLMKRYEMNVKHCCFCEKALSYSKRRNKFCNHSCAASFTNKNKGRNLKHGNFTEKLCLECKSITTNIKFCSRKCCFDFQWKETVAKIETDGSLIIYSNGECSSFIARKYLIEKRGKKCESCLLAEWMEQSIPLNVHHIDGDAKNNKLDNVQLLCLNCHGLTDNYGSKNNGKSTRTYRYEK